MCFFFQAEDGIRDYKVTGVQTCALPIWSRRGPRGADWRRRSLARGARGAPQRASAFRPRAMSRRKMNTWLARKIGDRKSTRLNSSHLVISYAVFCLKKKKKRITMVITTI